MALTEAQIVDLSKMIGEGYQATRSALPVVTAVITADDVIAINAELVTLLTEYNRIENKHLKVKGGKDGIDLDNDRNRLSLMKRARVLLGFSNPISGTETSGDSNAIHRSIIRGACWS